MVALLRSWGDSLRLLTPSGLKQWGLVTLKRSLDAYRILLKNFWWLILALIGVVSAVFYYEYLLWKLQSHVTSRAIAEGWSSFAEFNALVAYYTSLNRFLGISAFLLIAIWFYCCLLAVRPSLIKKDFGYFVSYWAHVLASMVVVVLMFLVLMAIAFFCLLLWPHLPLQQNPAYYSVIAGSFIFLQFVMTYMLFFLFDTKAPFRSLFTSMWNGIKLAVYQFPIALLVCSMIYILSYPTAYIRELLASYGFVVDVFVCLLCPVYLAMLLYIYVTEIHSHPERY
ncbi:MAG: hypothetical protein AB7F19_01350 [Candidatus Babeliales bacterium]